MKLANYGQWDCVEFATCAHGQAQSPVHIHSETCDHAADPLTYDYHETALHVVNNGHTVQFNYEPGSRLSYHGERYELVQFHFHLPGEHQIDGTAFAMEAHFVHKNADGGAVVVGVMIAQGDDEHPAYARLWQHMPKTPHTETHLSHVQMNALTLLPGDAHTHYYYEGSLTTPPCTEGVQWVVLAEPVHLSAQQIETFRALYEGNNRPLQPLNGRAVHLADI